MRPEDMSDDERLLVKLTNPPFHLDFASAQAAVRNGSAAEMIATVENNQAEAKAAAEAELQKLKDEHDARAAQCTKADGSPLPAGHKAGDGYAGILDKDAKDKLIESLGERVKKQSELLSVKAEKPPGQATLSKIAADVKNAEAAGIEIVKDAAGFPVPFDERHVKAPGVYPAQTSEPPGAVATGARRLFFVCRVCLGGFVVEPGTPGVVECQCGRAKFGDDGVAPFSEMGIKLQTSDALDVTELVECGKLSAVLPTPDAERFPWLVVFAVHNRNTRNVPQRSAVDVCRVASDGVKAGVLPATDYMHRAAVAGARVQWHSHYHTRACGVEKTEDKGDFLKREATGDARFCGSVIVREMKNEADGSLLFSPVMGCARCGKDHKQPLAFWKLSRPVYHDNGASVPATLIATHFATCPDTGEPVMMLSSETEAPEFFGNAAEADFTKPAPNGKVEQPVNAIDGANPVDGPTPSTLTTVNGVGRSDAHEAGRLAGIGSASITSDPHPPGSRDSEEWRTGFIEGRSARHGE